MIRKAFLFSALAAVIGASAGGATNALAAGQGGGGSGGSGAGMFQRCDTNGDGSLTADEFKSCHRDSAKAERKFKRLDANNDGKVTREEARSAQARAKANRRSLPVPCLPATAHGSARGRYMVRLSLAAFPAQPL